VTSYIGDVAAVVPATTASAAAAETVDSQTTNSTATAMDTAACCEAVPVTKLVTSTATASTSSRRSSVVRTAQSTTVVEEPAYADEQSQCSECKKSFRSDTLLEYHKKYYHHVAATDGSTITSRRSSLPSSGVERVSSGRFRSKNKSTCKCLPSSFLFTFCIPQCATSFSVFSAFLSVHPSGCWSTAPHAVVLTLMREHYYCVYLYMLSVDVLTLLLIFTKQLPVSGL